MLSPTIYTVDSTGSGTLGSGMSGTLPYVISQANVNTNTDGSEIEFESSLFSTPQTITPEARLVLSETSGPEEIDGSGAGFLTISGNNAQIGVAKGVTASISGATVIGSRSYGGAWNVYSSIYIDKGGTASVDECAVGGTPGIAVANAGNATFAGCTFNYSKSGLLNRGTATLTDCTISGTLEYGSATYGYFNYSSGYSRNYFGDSLTNNGTATLNGCTISGNRSYDGGGLVNNGTATLNDCTISGNSSTRGGGLINGGTGTSTLNGCTISGNSVGGQGGGLENLGTATLNDCTISSNTADSQGGGVENYGTATLTGCTISGNSAGSQGGGLYNSGFGFDATLNDCTIANNYAGSNGGGVYNSGFGTTLAACTISGNYAGSNGGGVYNSGFGTTTLIDTIVAGNSGYDISGGGITGSYDLIGLAAYYESGLQNEVNDYPDLGPLGDYGGPTQTMPLLPGSPAIGVGTSVSGITTDQRGFPLDSPNPDIGAFQVQPGLVVNTTIDGTGSPSGDLSLRQAVNLANAHFDPADPTLNSTITFAGSIAGDTISLVSRLELDGSRITIIGPITLNGASVDENYVLDLGSEDSLQDLTITSCDGTAVGMYAIDSVVTGCTIIDNGGGIEIWGSDNTIGGTTAGAGNIISDNAGNGITVGLDVLDAALDNAILENAIDSNNGLGISIDDSAPQAAPVLTTAISSVSQNTITGTLTGAPNSTFRIEFFSNPTGTSQGETYLGFLAVTTNGSGSASFSFAPNSLVAAGLEITATATDQDGNTSEFSAAATVTAPTNVTSDLSVKSGGFVYNRTTRQFSEILTITNLSDAPIMGPIDLVLLNLKNATLANQTGSTQGNPYVTILSRGSLGVGQSLTITLVFTDPTLATISYTPEFLAGP